MKSRKSREGGDSNAFNLLLERLLNVLSTMNRDNYKSYVPVKTPVSDTAYYMKYNIDNEDEPCQR